MAAALLGGGSLPGYRNGIACGHPRGDGVARGAPLIISSASGLLVLLAAVEVALAGTAPGGLNASLLADAR